MPYVKPPNQNGPVGVNPAIDEDRMPVVKVVNGDSWVVDAEVWNPVDRSPGAFENVVVEFVLSENRFEKPLWLGTWYRGVVPDDVVPGLVHAKVPLVVSCGLRRGVYAFSMKVTSRLGNVSETELTGHFQVEYEPSSAIHEIPYRPGTKEDEGVVAPSEGSGDSWYDGTGQVYKAYRLLGSVKTYDDLPDSPQRGDVWNVVESVDDIPAGTNWVWTGSSWDPLGGSITTETVQQAIEKGGYGLISFDEHGNPYVSVPDGGSDG